jgi:phosphocarrier protein
MIEKQYIILAPDGLHARPATALVRFVRQFSSTFQLEKEGRAIPLDSLLAILSLGAKGGDTLTFRIKGEDEEKAAEALDKFFEQQINTAHK